MKAEEIFYENDKYGKFLNCNHFLHQMFNILMIDAPYPLLTRTIIIFKLDNIILQS